MKTICEFDLNVSEIKSAMSKRNFIRNVVALLIIEMFPLLTTLLFLLVIPSSETDKNGFVLGWFCLVNIFAILSWALSVMIFHINEKNKKHVFIFNDKTVDIIAQKGYEKVTFTIGYSDIKKVYLENIAKFNFYEKIVGKYLVFFETKTFLKNGVQETFKKYQTGTIYFADSLYEANEVLQFLNSKIKEKAGDDSLH